MALTTEIETITPQKAEEYLTKNHCNRPISRATVDKYKRLIEEGLFELTHQGLGFDSRSRLRDGQHRLLAIIESGKSAKLLVTRGLSDKAVQAIDDGRKRSDQQVLTMAVGEAVGSLTTAIAREMYGGALHFGTGQRQLQPIRMDLISFFEAHRKAIEFANELFKNHATGLSIGYIAAAVARASYTVSQKKLRRFSELLNYGFAEEGEAVSQDEKWVIKLRSNILKTREKENHTRAQRDLIYGKVERAIQAYAKGETSPTLEPPKKELFRIEGDDEREALIAAKAEEREEVAKAAGA